MHPRICAPVGSADRMLMRHRRIHEYRLGRPLTAQAPRFDLKNNSRPRWACAAVGDQNEVAVVIVFGVGRAQPKDFGSVAPMICPNCHNPVVLRYILATTWFRLYFLPVVPLQRRHLMMCPVCSRGIMLTGTQAKGAKNFVSRTEAWRDGRLEHDAYVDELRRFWAGLDMPQPQLPTAPPPGLISAAPIFDDLAN
jgi:hypothetical protein